MGYFSFGIIGISLLAGIVSLDPLFSDGRWIGVNMKPLALVAFAEDDDDDEEEEEEEDEEEDDEDDEEDESPSSAKKSSQTETVTKQVVTYETRIVNDPEFLIDTDQDGLVDGVDPEPNFDFREYFTDIDGDGVPNAFDKHHDEDDFSYHDEEVDENNNGILDSYE